MKYALKKFVSLPMIIAAVCLLVNLGGCGNSDPQSPEQRVRAVLSEIEGGVEARSLSQIMNHVRDGYKDHQGHDKNAVAQLMQFQILRNQNINVFTLIKSVEVVADNASVELSAALASKELDLSLEENRLRADAYQFSIALIKENDRWLVQSVSWQRGW